MTIALGTQVREEKSGEHPKNLKQIKINGGIKRRYRQKGSALAHTRSSNVNQCGKSIALVLGCFVFLMAKRQRTNKRRWNREMLFII